MILFIFSAGDGSPTCESLSQRLQQLDNRDSLTPPDLHPNKGNALPMPVISVESVDGENPLSPSVHSSDFHASRSQEEIDRPAIGFPFGSPTSLLGDGENMFPRLELKRGSTTGSVELACLEAKRRKMADSRTVRSAGSLQEKRGTASLEILDIIETKKRRLSLPTDEVEKGSLTHSSGERSPAGSASPRPTIHEVLSPSSTSSNNTSYMLYCSLCATCFVREEDVRIHLSGEHSVYRFMCRLCGCTNDDELIIYEHVRTSHPSMFLCLHEGCKYSSVRRASVTAHALATHQRKGFIGVREGTQDEKYLDKQKAFFKPLEMWQLGEEQAQMGDTDHNGKKLKLSTDNE